MLLRFGVEYHTLTPSFNSLDRFFRHQNSQLRQLIGEIPASRPTAAD